MSVRAPAAALLCFLAAACANEAAETDERGSVKEATPDDGEGAGAAVDPTGGRDTSIGACLAACQNASLSCAAKGASRASEAFVEIGEAGCAGEITSPEGATAPFRIDCTKHSVCVGDACVDGTFSATTLGYGTTVCTRN